MPPKKIPLSAATRVVEPLTSDDMLKLVVPGLGSAARPALDDWGYNGGAAAFIGLALDSTNLLVQYGNLYLIGQLFDDDREVQVSGDKLWQGCPATTRIVFSFKNLGVFQFRGKLASELVPLEAFEPKLLVGESLVDLDEFAAGGGGNVCVRATVYPETHDHIRLILTAFPLARDELLDTYTGSDTSGLPGVRVISECIPMVPNKCKKWGMAFLPLLLTGAPCDSLSGDLIFQLKKAIHAILSKGVKPIGASSAASLGAKLEQLKGEEPIPSAALPMVWSTPSEFVDSNPVDIQGESKILVKRGSMLYF